MKHASKKPRTGDYSSSTCDDSAPSSNFPQLPYEAIAHVARFAGTSGKKRNNDLQNICVAAGKKNVGLIRRTFLKQNYGFLQRSMMPFSSIYSDVLNESRSSGSNEIPINAKAVIGKCHQNILEWMEINSDWKKLVTKERVKSFSYTDLSSQYPNLHLSIFNNISLATSLGLVSVVRHLIEDMDMDINGYYSFRIASNDHKIHILATAFAFYDSVGSETLDYLLSFANIDVSAFGQMFHHFPFTHQIALLAFEPRFPLKFFEVVFRHKSNDARKVSFNYDVLDDFLRFVQDYIRDERRDLTEIERDNLIAKMKIIIKMGADEQNALTVHWESLHERFDANYLYDVVVPRNNEFPQRKQFFLTAREELRKYQNRT